MRSTEFIQEAGPGGPGFIPTDAQLAARAAQGEKNAQGIKNFFAGAPQTGGTAVPTARDPAQQAGQGAPAPEAPAPQTGGTAVPTARDPAQIAGQGVTAPDAPVPASPPAEIGIGVAPPTQTSTPVPKKTFTPDPAGVAIAQQLKMDSNAIKLFQKNQGLNPDGQIGPRTTAALKAAQLKQGNVAANDKGGARGGAAFAATDPRRTDAAGGGQTGYNPPPATARPAAPPRPRLGMAAQFEWDRQYGKTHNADGTAKGTIAQPATQPAVPEAESPAAPVKGYSPTDPGQKIDPLNDPQKIRHLQQNLKAAGAKVTVNGVMDPATQAAMEKYPTALKGYPWMTGLKLTPKEPGAPLSSSDTYDSRRDFEESVDRMRRLSTMLKG